MELETGSDNKILRTISEPVKRITPEHRQFAVDMIKTMFEEEGVGIAAPQVGRNIRMVICKLNPGEKNEVVIPMVNPEILQESEETMEGEEGCLSLPGLWGKIRRRTAVLMRYTDLKGKTQTLELVGFNARIIQHEIDHLNGTLFADKAYDLQEAAKSKRSRKKLE